MLEIMTFIVSSVNYSDQEQDNDKLQIFSQFLPVD